MNARLVPHLGRMDNAIRVGMSEVRNLLVRTVIVVTRWDVITSEARDLRFPPLLSSRAKRGICASRLLLSSRAKRGICSSRLLLSSRAKRGICSSRLCCHHERSEGSALPAVAVITSEARDLRFPPLLSSRAKRGICSSRRFSPSRAKLEPVLQEFRRQSLQPAREKRHAASEHEQTHRDEQHAGET